MRPRAVRTSYGLGWGLGLLALGCAHPAHTSAGRPPGAEAATRYAGGPDPAVTPPERQQSAVCKEVDPGPTHVRRLTRFEYNNTVCDLLGDGSRPADEFPLEEKRDGFENNAESLTV